MPGPNLCSSKEVLAAVISLQRYRLRYAGTSDITACLQTLIIAIGISGKQQRQIRRLVQLAGLAAQAQTVNRGWRRAWSEPCQMGPLPRSRVVKRG